MVPGGERGRWGAERVYLTARMKLSAADAVCKSNCVQLRANVAVAGWHSKSLPAISVRGTGMLSLVPCASPYLFVCGKVYRLCHGPRFAAWLAAHAMCHRAVQGCSQGSIPWL